MARKSIKFTVKNTLINNILKLYLHNIKVYQSVPKCNQALKYYKHRQKLAL